MLLESKRAALPELKRAALPELKKDMPLGLRKGALPELKKEFGKLREISPRWVCQ